MLLMAIPAFSQSQPDSCANSITETQDVKCGTYTIQKDDSTYQVQTPCSATLHMCLDSVGEVKTSWYTYPQNDTILISTP